MQSNAGLPIWLKGDPAFVGTDVNLTAVLPNLFGQGPLQRVGPCGPLPR